MANNDMDRVVPLGQLDDFKVAEGDPDVRGWEVLASDGRKIGEVDELLVDTTAMKVRYLDVDVDGGLMGDGQDRHVLIPIGYARLEQERDCVMVDGLASSDLVGLPRYDQGPLTRDFESSVRDSFSGRGGSTGAPGGGMMDTAGMNNTPGTGTGMAGLSGGMPADDDRTLGAGVRDGEGMRAAGYDLDRSTTSPLHSGSELREPGSMGTGTDAGGGSASRDEWTSGGMSAGSVSGGGQTLGGSASGGVTGGGAGDRMSAGPASSGGSLGGGGNDRMSAGGQGPAGGMGTDREPQGDTGHGAGMVGSDYLHNADADFYASDAFDDGRFYGGRRGETGGASGLGGGGSLGGVGGNSGVSQSPEGLSAGSGSGLTPGARGEPGHGTGDVNADREETHRLAQEARDLLRQDHENRGVGGHGGL